MDPDQDPDQDPNAPPPSEPPRALAQRHAEALLAARSLDAPDADGDAAFIAATEAAEDAAVARALARALTGAAPRSAAAAREAISLWWRRQLLDRESERRLRDDLRAARAPR